MVQVVSQAPKSRSTTPARSAIAVSSGLVLLALGLVYAHVTIGSDFITGLIFVLMLCITFAISTGAGAVLRVYVLFVAGWFLLGGVLGLDPSVPLGPEWVAATVWLIGWSSGQLLWRARPLWGRARPADRKPIWTGIPLKEATFALALLGVIAMALQIVQIARGTSAYALQLNGETSTGLSSTVASIAGSALAAALICAWMSCGPRVKFALVLAVLGEGALQSFSGFRGSTVEYLAAALLAFAAVLVPRRAVAARHVVIGVIVVLAVGIPGTSFDSSIRSQIEGQAGRSNQTALTVENLPRAAISRLDEISNLAAGLSANSTAAHDVVNPANQISVFIPRFLWPSKPSYNYGEQIATVIYHLDPNLRTSSTITWLGDLYLIGGMNLILAAGVLLGALYRHILTRASRGTPLNVVSAVLVIGALLDPENSLVLSTASVVRGLLLLMAACLLVSRFRVPGQARQADQVLLRT